jgi:murein DD-endopeptidase MepM/ murein hydrolase activator NlpD
VSGGDGSVALDLARDVTRIGTPGASQRAASTTAGGGQRAELLRVAQQFEAMFLTQMLRDMRRAGSWSEEGGEPSGLGLEAFNDTIDNELALQLARQQSIGIADHFMRAFDRIVPGAARPSTAESLGADVPESPGPGVETPEDSWQGESSRAVTSPFGWRRDPLTGGVRFHKGVDLRAAYGEEVRAMAEGTVVFSGTEKDYGQTLVLAHADGTRARYAHLSSRAFEVGARVPAGQPIGRAGQSGRATGPHLHFEVTGPSGEPIPPGEWMQRRANAPSI